MTKTVTLHQVFTAPVERVYRAFTDPDALAKWMAPHGFTARVEHQYVQVGGTYKMSFSNFSTGSQHSFKGTYLEVIPNKLLTYTDEFDDPNLPNKIQVSVNFKKVPLGTEIYITQSNLPEIIPEDACYMGWQESLQLLSLLVTPSIDDD